MTVSAEDLQWFSERYREVTEVSCETWWRPGVVLIGEAQLYGERVRQERRRKAARIRAMSSHPT